MSKEEEKSLIRLPLTRFEANHLLHLIAHANSRPQGLEDITCQVGSWVADRIIHVLEVNKVEKN